MKLRTLLIIGIVLELFIGAAAAAGYFLCYTKTPTYSLNQAKKAFYDGNYEAFERYVDLDTILTDESQELLQLVNPENKELAASVKNGKAATIAMSDIQYYFEKNSWPSKREITPADELVGMSGLESFSFRSIEYCEKDMEDESDGTTATFAVKIYEPTYGDNYTLIGTMRQQEDGQWKVTGLENYGDFILGMRTQHMREFKRYAVKVADILESTENQLASLKAARPNMDKQWVSDATSIMKQSNEKINQLDVPRSGLMLDALLKERKDIFLDMMDAYYESNERRQPRGLQAKLDQLNHKWADNKAKLKAITDSAKAIDI